MTSLESDKAARSVVPIMLVLLGAELLSSLESAMIYTALPIISRELGGLRSTGWLISAYVLVQAATAAVGGRLGDIFGRRRMLLIVLMICSTGSLISAFAHNLEWVIVGRAVQGCCGAILPLCYGMVRQVLPAKRLPFWIGIMAGGYSGSAVIGFPLGGLLAETAGWHSIFYVTLILPLLLAPFVAVLLPGRPEGEVVVSRIDWLGGALFGPGVAGVLIAITYGSDWGWADWKTLGVAAIALGVLAVWARHELRCPEPLFNLRLLANKGVALGNFTFFLLGLGSFQLPLVAMMLLQQPVWTGVGLGVGAAVTGLLKLPGNGVAAIAGPAGGWVTGRYGARAATAMGAFCCLAGWLGLALWHGDVVFITLMSVAVGFGQTSLMAAVANLILGLTPRERAGEVTGLSIVVRTAGTATGAQVAGVLLATSVVTNEAGKAFPSADAYQLTFWAITGAMALMLAAALAIPRPRRAEPVLDPPAPAVAQPNAV